MGGKDDKRKIKPTTATGQDQDRSRPDRSLADMTRSLYDWAYHGAGDVVSSDGRTHILVEDVEFGPTERQNVTVLRELAEPAGGFGWGYRGSGPLRVSAAILADALKLGDPAACGIDPLSPRPDAVLIALRGDFTWEVTSQLCEEWRLRRGEVLRWVHGWYAEHGITAPQAASQLSGRRPLFTRRRAQDRSPLMRSIQRTQSSSEATEAFPGMTSLSGYSGSGKRCPETKAARGNSSPISVGSRKSEVRAGWRTHSVNGDNGEIRSA